MAKRRSRRRTGVERGQPAPAGGRPRAGADKAPTGSYTDPEGNVLELRGSLTVGARAEYAATLSGGLNREDAWQRAIELLFERLAVSWTIAGLRIERQRELLGRYRLAGVDERRFVREALREHLTANFPEMEAP